MIGNGNGHTNGHGPSANGHFRFDDPPPGFEPPPPDPNNRTWTFEFFPTISWWLERDIPPRDNIFGEWLSTTSRVLLQGPTDQGKTSLCLAISIAIAAGLPFLHWKAGREARVLYIDGEMPRRLIKRRLADAIRRCGCQTDNFLLLSREDFPDMPPLNSLPGQKFVDQFIQFIGPVDLIVFDNIQSLLDGDMLTPEQWSKMLRWVRDLTTRKIGQLWIHHTNSDGRGYGDKTREWQMEAVIKLETADNVNADIAFNLQFTKHRERTPDNFADFEPALITLQNDCWISDRSGTQKTQRSSSIQDIALAALDEALEKVGEPIYNHPNIIGGTICVPRDLWLKYFEMRYMAEDQKTLEKHFYRTATLLSKNHKTAYSKPFCHRV